MIVTLVFTDGWAELVIGPTVRDDACRRVHGPAPLLCDGLRVPVIELALGVGMDAAVRAVVLIGLYLAIGCASK